jgi:hypothetical protein
MAQTAKEIDTGATILARFWHGFGSTGWYSDRMPCGWYSDRMPCCRVLKGGGRLPNAHFR